MHKGLPVYACPAIYNDIHTSAYNLKNHFGLRKPTQLVPRSAERIAGDDIAVPQHLNVSRLSIWQNWAPSFAGISLLGQLAAVTVVCALLFREIQRPTLRLLRLAEHVCQALSCSVRTLLF